MSHIMHGHVFAKHPASPLKSSNGAHLPPLAGDDSDDTCPYLVEPEACGGFAGGRDLFHDANGLGEALNLAQELQPEDQQSTPSAACHRLEGHPSQR